MVTRVLVANRGEIACRVFRTCRALGIGTAAVYSDADAGALHVREADRAVRLPGAAPADTYLRADLIVAAARAAGADAVHPGYGFLSESAAFARTVADAGLVWIGPPPDAIAAMASKTRAKELMAAAGVPLFTPVDPAGVTAEDLPLLVKAAAGGGGRGMRVVRDLAGLPGAWEAAAAEARAAFGDGEVFAEPYVEHGRHVEVQVLADAYGTVWPLGTRDCSLQRRHQKVVEEAPAPALPSFLTEELYGAAVAAARAVGYRGAGTVEFLVSTDGRPYFLEMNTRLQVEHPVTEEVFGIDLVALQLAVAEGERLPEGPPRPRGHAVEARLYAEDPAAGWAPQAGRLHRFDVAPSAVPPVPVDGPRVRVDAGVAAGDTVGVHYDALLAKIVVRASTRAAALRTLAHVLAGARLHGPPTNRDLLVAVLRHPEFAAGPVDTGFLERHAAELTAPAGADGEAHAALAAALADAAARRAAATTVAARIGAWRNLPSAPQTKVYGEHEVRYRATRHGDEPVDDAVRVVAADVREVRLDVAGVVRRYAVHAPEGAADGTVYVDADGAAYRFAPAPRFPGRADGDEPGTLLAPMPGTVVRVADGLTEGVAVEAGRPLLWLEAMKMEHRVTAPVAGTLTALHAVPGSRVEVGTPLAVIGAAEGPDTPKEPAP